MNDAWFGERDERELISAYRRFDSARKKLLWEMVELLLAVPHRSPSITDRLSSTVSTRYFLSLSAREQEILDLLALGCTNREIAGTLGVSLNTVKNQINTLFRKLGVTNRTEAALCAARQGPLPVRSRIPVSNPKSGNPPEDDPQSRALSAAPLNVPDQMR